MSELAAQDTPLNQAMSFHGGTDHQQGQKKEKEVKGDTTLSAKLALPGWGGGEDQQEGF